MEFHHNGESWLFTSDFSYLTDYVGFNVPTKCIKHILQHTLEGKEDVTPSINKVGK